VQFPYFVILLYGQAIPSTAETEVQMIYNPYSDVYILLAGQEI
jgi:hypothetical protein